jgi:hypothetical protein
MELLKMLGIVWIGLLFIFVVGIIFGAIIEKNFEESHPLKKWWRRHILAPDPDDIDRWKNFRG